MADADELQRQQVMERRLRAMGLEAALLPGGRSVVATLPLDSRPFETPEGPRRLRAMRFFTVGFDRIKCAAPRALFHLPMIRIVDCDKPEQIEARVRAAWTERLAALREARRWLDGLGVAVDAPQGAPLWSFSLGLEDPLCRAVVVEPGRLILPARGPLSGVVLASPSERVFTPDPGCRSGSDLEIAAGVRIEALARRRRATAARGRTDAEAPTAPTARGVPLLIVGSRLAAAGALQESLRLRGFEAACASSAAAAVEAFRGRTFEMVVAETRLDRGDGIELVPALRRLPGILELPVVLFDERPSEARRAASRAAGASGYLSGPLDAARLAAALAQLAAQRQRRRFVRYTCSLSVSWPACDAPAVTTEIGRGGFRLRGAAPVPEHGRVALHLPETGRTLRAEACVVYRLGDHAPWPTYGVGLRFWGFDEDAEAAWIDYLAGLQIGGPPLAGSPNGGRPAGAESSPR